MTLDNNIIITQLLKLPSMFNNCLNSGCNYCFTWHGVKDSTHSSRAVVLVSVTYMYAHKIWRVCTRIHTLIKKTSELTSQGWVDARWEVDHPSSDLLSATDTLTMALGWLWLWCNWRLLKVLLITCAHESHHNLLSHEFVAVIRVELFGKGAWIWTS